MKTKPFYLVIDTKGSRGVTVNRVRQSWPDLLPGEIFVKLTLDIPDDLLPRIQEIVLEDPEAARVGVEAVAV